MSRVSSPKLLKHGVYLKLTSLSELSDIGSIHLKRVWQRLRQSEVSAYCFHFSLRFQTAQSVTEVVPRHSLYFGHVQTCQHTLVCLTHSISIIHLQEATVNRYCLLFLSTGLRSTLFMSPVIA
jgi:hypothetical protein